MGACSSCLASQTEVALPQDSPGGSETRTVAVQAAPTYHVRHARKHSDQYRREMAQQLARSREIDRDLRRSQQTLAAQVKILLLGAGESGKTTVLKQMRLIHTSGFTAKERAQWRTIVFANVVQAMRDTLHAMDALELTFERDENDEHVDLILSDRELAFTEPLPPEYLPALRSLWEDGGVQAGVAMGNQFALHDNCTYFYSALDRIFRESYLPTDQDILRCRLKTTGIHETVFHLRDLTYRMVDVGGQRSERKKWIHCFEGVTSVLFLANVAGYDQVLEEDRSGLPEKNNQMREAIMLFDSICNSHWFAQSSMIVFLNKIDLLRSKLRAKGGVSHVREYFPEFVTTDDGGGDDKRRARHSLARDAHKLDADLQATLAFFKQKFAGTNRDPDAKNVYTHYTNATDTNLLRNVMLSVTDTILQRNLQDLDL
ncbi:hypothetical protein PYCC9005_005168 [Savitreella phatthalungensis]